MKPAAMPDSLGAVIRRRRTELGWSQEELAGRASGDGDEVRQSDISRLERGRVGLPRRARLLRIAAALGLSPGDLLARSGWAGADRVLDSPPAPVPAPRPVVDLAPAPPGSTVPPLPEARPHPSVAADPVSDRLRRAIVGAQATRRQTERALRRAGEVLAYADAPRRVAAPPRTGEGVRGASAEAAEACVEEAPGDGDGIPRASGEGGPGSAIYMGP